MIEECALTALYDRLDEAAADHLVLALLSDDFCWEFSLPDRVAAGDLVGFRAFLDTRRTAKGPRAAHQLLTCCRSERHELLLGLLTIEGSAPQAFVAAAELDGMGRIRRLMLRRTDKLDFAAPVPDLEANLSVTSE